MTKPPEPVVTGELKLIDAIISAYHTTRLSEVSAAEHILSKPYVRKLLDIYRTAHALPGDVGATGPWMKVGTFEPDPDALYLVQGTLRTSVKRGSEIEADNVAAALIAPSIAALSGDAGEGE